MPVPRQALSEEELRAIWFDAPLPVVRSLLWEIRRLRDENARLRKVAGEVHSFAVAVQVRGGMVGDMQLQVYWNRVRAALEEAAGMPR